MTPWFKPINETTASAYRSCENWGPLHAPLKHNPRKLVAIEGYGLSVTQWLLSRYLASTFDTALFDNKTRQARAHLERSLRTALLGNSVRIGHAHRSDFPQSSTFLVSVIQEQIEIRSRLFNEYESPPVKA